MNYLSVLSLITAMVGVGLIGATLFLDESLMLAAAPVVVLSVYLDHLSIRKSFRDFYS